LLFSQPLKANTVP